MSDSSLIVLFSLIRAKEVPKKLNLNVTNLKNKRFLFYFILFYFIDFLINITLIIVSSVAYLLIYLLKLFRSIIPNAIILDVPSFCTSNDLKKFIKVECSVEFSQPYFNFGQRKCWVFFPQETDVDEILKTINGETVFLFCFVLFCPLIFYSSQ